MIEGKIMSKKQRKSTKRRIQEEVCCCDDVLLIAALLKASTSVRTMCKHERDSEPCLRRDMSAKSFLPLKNSLWHLRHNWHCIPPTHTPSLAASLPAALHFPRGDPACSDEVLFTRLSLEKRSDPERHTRHERNKMEIHAIHLAVWIKTPSWPLTVYQPQHANKV